MPEDLRNRLGRRASFITVIAALVLAGFILRLAFGVGYWVGKPLTRDEREYLLLAARVAAGQGFNYPPAPESNPLSRHFERPPMFPFVLAGVLRIAGDPLVKSGADDAAMPRSSSEVSYSIRIAQSMLGAFGILLIAAFAGRAAGPWAAVAATCIAAVYPPLVWMCAYVLAEPLYSALALAAALLVQKASAHSAGQSLRLAFSAGVLAGFALLTKEAMLAFLPLAALWLVFRRRSSLAALLLAGAALVAVPWAVRNYVVEHRFVLTAAHGGITLWTGNNPWARGEGDLSANPEMAKARLAFEDRHPGSNSQDLDGLYYREVFQFVTEHPVEWATLCARKLFYTFVPIGPSYRQHSRLYYVASVVSIGALAPFAVIGLWRLIERGHLADSWGLALLFVSTVLVGLVFSPQERFRIPVMDPTLIVMAAACFGWKRWN